MTPGSDRIYICTDCDGDPRVRWDPPSAGFYIGCDCTSVPVVPQMGQFDAPDNWRVDRPICCTELDVTNFEYVYGGDVGHDYKCPDCGAVYRSDGRMVERPDAMLDEVDDDQTVLPDGGTRQPGTERLTVEEIESRPHPSKMDNEAIWEESDELVEVHREISGGHLNDLINERWGKMLTVLEHRIDPDYPECPHCESTSSIGYAEDGVVVCQSCYETLPEDVREQYREEYSRVWGGIDSDEGGESDGS